MSGSTFLVMTVLMVLGVLFVIRLISSTVSLLFNSLLVIALVGGGAYLFLKARGTKS
jgi:hypothetical protein